MAAHARRIVVGFDGSQPALRALEAAAELVGYGSTLVVVTVLEEGTGDARAALAEARDRLLRYQVAATYVQRVGEPARELVEAARELEADLVVVGASAGALPGRSAPGSVGDEVVRSAPCDVLVVR